MNKFFRPLLLLVLAPWAALAQATTVRQALPLRAVTLYLDAAELHHEGSATLPAGAVDVRVTGLAPTLTGYALQADATGAELDGLETVAGSPWRTVGRDTLGRRSREVALLTAERDFLKQNSQAQHNTPGRWAEETMRAAATYSARLVQIEERLAALSTAAAADVIPPDLLLHLQVPRAGLVRLRVSYRVTSTAWQPTYELRVSEPNLRQLRVVSRAYLYNGSGLPWTNLPVTLRTNTPSIQIDRPAFDPWTVAFGRAGNEGEGNLDDFAVKGPGTTGTTATGTPAAAEAPDLGASLRLPTPVTLAEKANRTYLLGSFTLPMRLEYLAIPKKDEEVFLVGRVSDWNQVNFLSETATVFYRGTYVGTTTLDTRAYTDTLEVSFGRDPQVQLTRTKREDFEGPTSGGSRTRTRLGYEINVKNTHPYAVRLRLLDQLPVSQEKEIAVKPIDLGGAALEEPSGKLTWLFNLAPGASRRFPIVFTVEAPAAQPINLRRDRRIKNPKFR